MQIKLMENPNLIIFSIDLFVETCAANGITFTIGMWAQQRLIIPNSGLTHTHTTPAHS